MDYTTHIQMPPKLETDRLVLRIFQGDDWRDLHEYCASEEATRYTYGKPSNEGETWRIMAAMSGHWMIHGYGPYALEYKENHKVIGACGLWYPADWPEPEIMWALSPHYWGQGFAFEAASEVKAKAGELLPELRPISLIDKDNQASIKLARALGARFEKEIPFRSGIAHIYRHTK